MSLSRFCHDFTLAIERVISGQQRMAELVKETRASVTQSDKTLPTAAQEDKFQAAVAETEAAYKAALEAMGAMYVTAYQEDRILQETLSGPCKDILGLAEEIEACKLDFASLYR